MLVGAFKIEVRNAVLSPILTVPKNERMCTQQEVLIRRHGPFAGETGQRNAPCPLPREHPIGPRFDHRMQTVTAGLRSPSDQLVNRRQSPFADGFAMGIIPANLFVDGREPLGRVAEDQRRFGAP